MNLAVILITAIILIAIVGQVFARRAIDQDILQKHEVVAEAMLGVVGTLFSVLLGLLVAGAIEEYHEVRVQAEEEANGLANVFRIARGFDDVDRKRIRGICREYVNAVLDEEWALMEQRQLSAKANDATQRLWEAVVSIKPTTDAQNNLHEGIVEAMKDFAGNRRIRIVYVEHSLHPILWAVIICGALVTIAFTYIFTARFGTLHTIMTVLIGVSLGLNIWLLAVYSSPYSGELQIKPTMFEMIRKYVLPAPDTPARYLPDTSWKDDPSPLIA